MVDANYTVTIYRDEKDGGNLYDVLIPFDDSININAFFRSHPEVEAITFKSVSDEKGKAND